MISLRTKIVSAFVVLLPFGAASPMAFGQVKVFGFTYEITENGYEPLPGVEVGVYRDDIEIFPERLVSGPDGAFHTDIPGTQPFHLVFFGPNKIPGTYFLAGKTGTANELHVVVLTGIEARKLGIDPGGEIERVLPRVRGNRQLFRNLQEQLEQIKTQDAILEGLNADKPFPFERTPNFLEQLQQLKETGLVRPQSEASGKIEDIPQVHDDLRQLFRPSVQGEEFLKLREKHLEPGDEIKGRIPIEQR